MNNTALELRRRAKLPVSSKGGGQTLMSFFEANRAKIAAVLPRHVTDERMLRVALQAVRTTPLLQECSVESLFGAVVQCSTPGLEPNDARGLSYLVPFWNSKQKVREAQMIVGYRGFIDLARRGGEVSSLIGRPVYEGDRLDLCYGSREYLEHKPCLTEDRGQIIGAYAIARLKEGADPLFVFLPWADIEKARAASSGAWYFDKKSGEKKPALTTPWWTDTEAMAAKTPVRRIAKWLPMNIELAQAVALDEKADRGESQRLDSVLSGEYEEVEAVEGDEPEPVDETAVLGAF